MNGISWIKMFYFQERKIGWIFCFSTAFFRLLGTFNPEARCFASLSAASPGNAERNLQASAAQ